MKPEFVKYLQQDSILIVDCDTKKKVLDAIVAHACTRCTMDEDQIREAILKRERMMTTGVGKGLALPHIRISGFPSPLVIVVVCRNPITDYKTLDEEPVKLAVFPLTKKDGMPEKAQEIINDLRFHFNCKYEEKDQIGKRYRRMDAIGCPYCVTVDPQTLEDNTVTLRDRDTMEQRRVNIADLRSIIEDQVSITSLLKKLL